MTRLLSATILGAALILGGALAPAEAASPNSTAADSALSAPEKSHPPIALRTARDEPALEGPSPEPEKAASSTALRVLLVLTVVVALLLLVSGLDDAFIDAHFWLRLAGRQKGAAGTSRVTLEQLNARQQAPFALMVPAWKEHDVIAAMIENTVKTLDYGAFRFFVGVYRNDPATAREVDRMVERYGALVVRVDVPHDGPTCKADCLNYIVRGILEEEHANGNRYAGLVLHDCEDVIHPLELKLFNALLPRVHLIQVPVFSLDRKWRELVAGTYIDDFAESHGKDIAVREALAGIVPGAGVATCYSRRAMAALWASSAGEPFNTATLTEDYDLSFRLAQLGMPQTFAHVEVDEGRPPVVRGKTGSVIATHEYFPEKFRAAVRQRARWAIGIAFQGWQQMRWQGTRLQRYFLYRDRKVLVMAPASALAYVLLFWYVLGVAFGSPEFRSGMQALLGSPALQTLLLLNLVFMLNRALQRMYFVGHYYGPVQGLLSVVRIPVNNLINVCAVMRAWRLFLGHLVTGKKLAWDKTAHVYPDALTLGHTGALGQAAAIAPATTVAAAPRQ